MSNINATISNPQQMFAELIKSADEQGADPLSALGMCACFLELHQDNLPPKYYDDGWVILKKMIKHIAPDHISGTVNIIKD